MNSGNSLMDDHFPTSKLDSLNHRDQPRAQRWLASSDHQEYEAGQLPTRHLVCFLKVNTAKCGYRHQLRQDQRPQKRTIRNTPA
jgi:hypothetical protein